MAEQAYTADEVTRAVNAGVDLITHDSGIYLSDRDHDLLNLAANAALSMLDEPDWTLDDVIEHNYETDPAEVRSWVE